MHYLTKQKRAAKVGDLMRNKGNGLSVLVVTKIAANGDLTAESYGHVIARKWAYSTRPRKVHIDRVEIPTLQDYPMYLSTGGNRSWLYDVVKINE